MLERKEKRERETVERRGFLRANAAAVVGGTAVSATASAQDIQFERSVDAVEDLGLDEEGKESINDVIGELPDRTLVRFPEGSFLVDGTPNGPETLGLQGAKGGLCSSRGATRTVTQASGPSWSTAWGSRGR